MKFFSRPKFKIGGLLILLAVFFTVLNFTDFAKEIRNFFYVISSPIQKNFWQIGKKASNFFEIISEKKNLKKEQEGLKSKIQELLAENINLKALKKENDFLREALKVGLEKEFKLTLAEVIGKDISQDSVLINKGSKDGISKNMPVITSQKVLVGKIGEVYDNFSKVMLISDKNSSFDAKVPARLASQGEAGGSDTEIYGLLQGKGNFKLLFDLVSKDKELKEGDILLTTALGGIFPKNLLVGKIEKIKKSDVEPFQQAEVAPLFDISQAEQLFIITASVY